MNSRNLRSKNNKCNQLVVFVVYKAMMYYLVSTDKENYGTVKFNSSIGVMSSLVAYRISALSTIASFSMVTNDDYMVIETTLENETIELTLHFYEHGAYEMRSLANTLNNLFEGELVPVEGDPPIDLDVEMDSTNRLIISANKEFTITKASHRVKLLLGLYDTQLPISSTGNTIVSPSVPFLCYGNVLYLTARTDFISSLNQGDKEITRSICYRVNEFLYQGVPVCCKLPGNLSIIHSDQLSSLEFQLVDFQLQPVILHAPLFITLEVQRLERVNQLNTSDEFDTDLVTIK